MPGVWIGNLMSQGRKKHVAPRGLNRFKNFSFMILDVVLPSRLAQSSISIKAQVEAVVFNLKPLLHYCSLLG